MGSVGLLLLLGRDRIIRTGGVPGERRLSLVGLRSGERLCRYGDFAGRASRLGLDIFYIEDADELHFRVI